MTPSLPARPRPGARYLGDGRTYFSVWAPDHEYVDLHIEGREPARLVPADRGYHELEVDAGPGTRYRFAPPGGESWPDPASISQPEGVHGPSEVLDTAFAWTDGGWPGVERRDYVFYELHVGTFTHEGTFDALIPHLDYLEDLGITVVELLPVSQFPGTRNWGYDGTYPYAAQDSYGGLRGLQRLVDACHARGLAVALDVVHNHLGPEGNYAPKFGPYFTDEYRTPWGAALNFDGPGSDEVRRFFIASALFWMEEAHVDILRLDAVHTIRDSRTAISFVEDLSTAVRDLAARSGRRLELFAETSMNDPRYIESIERGGRGVHGQWNDDFQHTLHSLITGERSGYYADYGSVETLARCYAEGYALQGDESVYYGRRHGRPSGHIPPEQMVVFAQNHDQVGNRPHSDRLSTIVDFESQKLAAAAVVLSPYLPLLFMGEEYGEVAPFWFFVDHGDPGLVEAVREGRKREFEAFSFGEDIADPGAVETFEACRLDHSLRAEGKHATLLRYYRELLRLRKTLPALRNLDRDSVTVDVPAPGLLQVGRRDGGDRVLLSLNFGHEPADIPGAAEVLLNSASTAWGGPVDLPVAGPASGGGIVQPPRSAMLVQYGQVHD